MSTSLDAYLTDAKINDAEFGEKIERDRSVVNKLRHGRLRPTLDVAAKIEEVTGGAVPMQSWTSQQAAAA